MSQFATGSEVRSIVFLDHPRSLVTNGRNTVLLFNLESGKLERTIELAGGGIRKFVADRAGSRLVVGFQSGSIGSLSLPDLTPGPRLEAHDGSVECLALAPTDACWPRAAPTGAWCYATRRRSALLRFPLWDGTPAGLTFDSTGRRLAIVGTGEDVDLWDLVRAARGLRRSAWPGTGPPAVVPNRARPLRASTSGPPFQSSAAPVPGPREAESRVGHPHRRRPRPVGIEK